jgi:hypothetical protein
METACKRLLLQQDAELKKSHQPIFPFLAAVQKLLLTAAVCGCAGVPLLDVFQILGKYLAVLAELATKFGASTAREYDEKLRRKAAQGKNGRELTQLLSLRDREALDDIVTARRLAPPPKAKSTPPTTGDAPTAKRAKWGSDPGPQRPKGKGKGGGRGGKWDSWNAGGGNEWNSWNNSSSTIHTASESQNPTAAAKAKPKAAVKAGSTATTNP